MKSCWMFNASKFDLTVIVAYIAVTNGGNIDSYAPRFTRTYLEFPPGYRHQLVIVCNGGPLNKRRRAYFEGLDAEFLERPNDEGKDISAYQEIARANPEAMICCLGESVYFHRAGWLARLAESRLDYGPGMYGMFSSHMVRAHLNTSGFMADARLLAKYPSVKNQDARYHFEHGHSCFWKRIHAGGSIAALVTWDGLYFPGEWRLGKDIMHRGNQRNCLIWCNHSEKWEHADAVTKKDWSAESDRPFRV